MNIPTYIAGTLQATAYRLLREHVYEALGHYDLNPTYWSMLGIITQAKNGVRHAEIAEALRVKPPLITVMARDLQERGLIHSVRNQFDGRAKLLALTPAGKKFVKTVEHTLNERLSQLLVGLTQDDMKAYHKVLNAIVANDLELRKHRKN